MSDKKTFTMDIVRDITIRRHPLKAISLQAGDVVKVHIRVKEGEKERLQVFEGVVLKVQGEDYKRSFTVRKVSSGVGVEKTIPLMSPNVANVEVLSQAKVRRARLFYLRKLQGRAARLNVKQVNTTTNTKPNTNTNTKSTTRIDTTTKTTTNTKPNTKPN